LKHCEKHGDYEPEIIGEKGTVFCIETNCPICEEEYQLRQKEREINEHKESNLRHLQNMNIEPAFYESSFDNFNAENEEQKHNVERVKALVSGDIKKIVMTGKNGTGKTHLACAALHILSGRIMTMYEISTTIRASYIRDAGESELQIVDGYARLPLFVIDEIGRTKGGDVEANWLSYIIDKRHVRDLPTILISNKHTRKTCPNSGCADCLENYIGEDIMSRLCENGVLLKFSGDDYRKRRE
jgi:DNA replication protein DnaC